MANIIGRFHFEIETNQNLTGTFSNNIHTRNYAENVIRVNNGSGFIGEYQSTWTDDKGSFEAKLKISQKNGSTEIYTLHWIGNDFEFFGEGYIVNGLLFGDYRNFQQVPTE